ncbi:hypothetical protein PMIN01_06770 [Paraphaeosphaeria minitans]|uniref:Uncharacterized protein n=1 Tax=Paraphaeosphaeria minitans TaxID=565426 RepID=A0A9P6GJ62_9PLEO|nr:hypothetical protein PMIN01_06770 [Paraphaeosphaeria minitans]
MCGQLPRCSPGKLTTTTTPGASTPWLIGTGNAALRLAGIYFWWSNSVGGDFSNVTPSNHDLPGDKTRAHRIGSLHALARVRFERP